MLRFLIFGDVVARIGREALKKIIPELKAEYNPHLIIANAENLAHGAGITLNTVTELIQAGVNVFTSGNHIWNNNNLTEVTENPGIVILRPANYSNYNPGQGYKLVNIKTENSDAKALIINLQGRVFMKDHVENPFVELDKILTLPVAERANAILLDFHADASSEKVAMCWHADGKVSGVWGTHTHVPTQDARVLPQGTAAVTDVGMTGFRDGVIGIDKNDAILGFQKGMMIKGGFPDTGIAQVNAVYIEVDRNSKKAVKLEKIRREVEIL